MEYMSAPIRTAVLGYGLAGRVFHCPFVSAVPGLELTAIVVSNPDRAAAAAAAYPNSRIVAEVTGPIDASTVSAGTITPAANSRVCAFRAVDELVNVIA